MTNSAGKFNLIEKYKERQESGEEYRQKAREAGEKIKESAQSKVVRGFVGGGVTAVNEGAEAIDDIYDSFAGNPYDNEDLINLKKRGLKIDSDEGDWRYEIPHMIGQYVLPGAHIFKGLKALPLAARAYTSGAIVDAFLTDPYEKNLFNIGVEHGPTFLNPLLNIFAAPDEEVNVHIARLKAVGAGAIQGKVIGEGVQAGVGVVKGAVGAVKDSGNSLLDGFIDKVLEMRNNPGSKERMTKALKEYKQLSLSDVQEVDQMIGSKKFLSDTEPAGRPTGTSKATGESVKGAPVKGEPVDQTYNPKTIKTADDLKDLLLSRLEKYKQKQSSLQQGDFPVKRTFPEMARAARNQLPQDTVLSLERFVDNFGPGGREDLPALIISMNDLVHEVLTKVGDLTKQMDQTLATGNRVRYDEIKEDFAANLKVFDGLINIHKTTKSILGQSLAANKVPGDAAERVTDIKSLFGRTSEEKFLDQAQNLRSSTDNLYDDPLTEFNIDEILKIADNGDTKQLRTLIRKIQIASNNPNALKTLIKEGGGTRFLKITNEIFVNSILSSPITHQVNMLSTALNTLARPIELALGAEDSISRARAGRELIYMVQSSVDSMKMAVAALRAEDNILDAGAMVSDVERFAIRMSGSGPLAKLTNGIGTLYRLPSRFLLAEDEFFKQLNFRSFAMAEAWEKGTRMGKQGADLEKYMNEQFNGIISIVNKQSKEGVFSKEIVDLYERARKFAAETTFTADLGKGTFSGDFQSFVSKHPTARLFFPFVRTPINILKSTFKRTPGVNRLMKEHMEALKSTDPSIRARAIGETKVGGTMWGLGITTAAAINVENAPIAITGGGPKDFNALNQKRATGWQPYSFRFLVKANEFKNVAETGKANEIIEVDQDTKLVRGADGKLKYRYVSYKRLDPWASFLSMSADAAEIGGHLPGGDYKNLADVMMVALARNLTEKTYLQGLTELTGLLDNEQKLSTWLGRRLAAITNPVSAMGRDTKKLFATTPSGERAILDKKVRPGDATGPMVFVRRYFNELAATVPGWNNDMPAIQNWITGKYVEYPIGFGKDNWNVVTDGWSTKTKSINDPVLSVLADLEANFKAPLDEFLDGQIKLTHRQYANLVYQTASTKRGGLRLYDRLLKTINKTRVQSEIQIARGFEITNANENVAVGASEDSRKFVLKELGDIVREYKETAKQEFLNLPENREIKKKYDQQIILQNRLRKEMIRKTNQSNSIELLQTL
tara:strand:+ start:3063 stop:6767 length:3705 start_codon:yes stop_codon:yes gene_type:complete